jgi:hypothetical protein
MYSELGSGNKPLNFLLSGCTVKKTAITLARKAWFELTDYATAKQRGIDRFTLMLERRNVNDQEQWQGTFEYGSKNLKVIGTLEG